MIYTASVLGFYLVASVFTAGLLAYLDLRVTFDPKDINPNDPVLVFFSSFSKKIKKKYYPESS